MTTKFTMENQAVMFRAMRLRPELREEDSKPDVDLFFSLRTSNDALAMLGSDLKSSLYKAPDQADLVGGLTVLRNPELGKLKIGKEIIGAKTVIHFGLGKAAGKNSDITLESTIVDRFTLEAMEGGSVIIGWRVRCKPTGDENGRLALILGRETAVSISEPEAAQGSLIDGTEGPGAEDKTGARVPLKD